MSLNRYNEDCLSNDVFFYVRFKRIERNIQDMAKFLDQDGLSHLLSKLDDRYATIETTNNLQSEMTGQVQTINNRLGTIENRFNYQSFTIFNTSLNTTRGINVNKDGFTTYIIRMTMAGTPLSGGNKFNLNIGPSSQSKPVDGDHDNSYYGHNRVIIHFDPNTTTGASLRDKIVTINCYASPGSGQVCAVTRYVDPGMGGTSSVFTTGTTLSITRFNGKNAMMILDIYGCPQTSGTNTAPFALVVPKALYCNYTIS